MIITIDGPTASGKSTVARELAKALGVLYINSGLLFRAIAYITAHNASLSLPDIFTDGTLVYRYSQEDGAQIFYHQDNITPLLKTSDVDRLTSQIALNPGVRDSIRIFQQKLARSTSIIAEGRDCGTVIFPHANYKFYITASLEVRASRWQEDQKNRGALYTLDKCIELIKERDLRDSQRTLAPLLIPSDAIIIDSSNLSIEEVVARCLTYIR